MADKKDKVEKDKEKTDEVPTRREKSVDCEAGDICLSIAPVYQALEKFCKLYIGIDENFDLLGLRDAMEKEQKKFVKLNDAIYQEVYGKPRPQMPEPPPDYDKMTKEEVAEENKKQREIAIKFAELGQKEITLTYLAVQISKSKLAAVMEREETKVKQGKDGILITPSEIGLLRKFIDFI